MQRVFAATETFGPGGQIHTSFAENFPTIGSFITVIVKNATVLAGLLAFILIIAGGFAIIVGAGGGDSKQMEKGKKTLTMAIVGLIVVVFALWIIRILHIILGVDPLNPFP